MKRLFELTLLLSAAFSSVAFGQSTQGPDCVFRFNFTTTGNSATFTNFTNTTGQACDYFLLTYATNGTVNTLSMVLQAAPAGATPTTAGTFVTYPGSAITGAITNTSTTGASAFLWNSSSSVPFLRAHMTTLSCTGACLVYGVLQGWNAGNAAGAAAAAAGGSGCPNPCPVIQGTASTLNATVFQPTASGFNNTQVNGQPAATTATWTSATTLNTAISIPVSGYGDIAMSYISTGSTTSGAITFEVSQDGTNWLALGVSPIGPNQGLVTNYTLAGGSSAWQMYIGGFTNARIRLSTVIGSGGSGVFSIAATASAAEFAAEVAQTNPANLQTQATLVGDSVFSSAQQSVTASAAPLANNGAKSACVQALPANTISVYVGASGVTTSTGFPLGPGQSFCGPVNNTNLIYVVASTTGASVAWILFN